MAGVSKVSISLTPEMAALINAAVKSGEYASSSEVIREALRGWRQQRGSLLSDVDEMRRLWNEGVKSGPSRYASIDEIKKEAHRRYGAEKKAAKKKKV